jgi:hypothetical protein
MRTRLLADGPRQKTTHKMRRKHRTPSEKEKKRTPKVFQRLYVFHLYAQRNHSLKTVRIEIKGTELGGTFTVLAGAKNVRKNLARKNKMAYVHQQI